MTYDIVAIGNALVDVLAEVDEALLAKHGLTKGAMMLTDSVKAATIYADMPATREVSGGSAGNTVAVLASLGGKGAYNGKVAADQLGQVYAHDMAAQGVVFANGASPSTEPTGRSLILITPDGERTMNTSLGCAADFTPEDVQAALIKDSKVVYLEGYLFDRPAAKAAFHRAAEVAHEAGVEVALTLSDSFCVERHRGDFLALINGPVDILFANQKEILALYETDNLEQAISQAASAVNVAVITQSEKGATIVAGPQRVAVPAAPVAKVVDLTGAGDAYAGGFLYGYTQGLSLAEAGRIGALAAAEVISHIGPRPEVRLSHLLAA